jgi:hypothetical protein
VLAYSLPAGTDPDATLQIIVATVLAGIANALALMSVPCTGHHMVESAVRLTIETWLNGIALKRPIEDCPAWPPDLYALAGTLPPVQFGGPSHTLTYRYNSARARNAKRNADDLESYGLTPGQ